MQCVCVCVCVCVYVCVCEEGRILQRVGFAASSSHSEVSIVAVGRLDPVASGGERSVFRQSSSSCLSLR